MLYILSVLFNTAPGIFLFPDTIFSFIYTVIFKNPFWDSFLYGKENDNLKA